MNDRTGELSLDGAWGIDINVPANPSVAMLNGYNGAALPSKAWADSVGRPLLLGFESAVDRAFAGGAAGQSDAVFSCNVFDAWGYPRECGSWVCAHDGNSTPGWALANIQEYGAWYGRIMVARGRVAPITVYGENEAVDAFIRGLESVGIVGLRWLVGTWGNGEGGGPNQPPARSWADQLQSGNSGGPYPATDLDWLFAPVATFRPYGLAAPAPKPPARLEESDMECFSGPYLSKMGDWRSIVFGPDGKVWGDYFGGNSGFGMVAAAAADAPSDTSYHTFKPEQAESQLWKRAIAIGDGKDAPGGVDDPDLDVDAAVADLLALLPPTTTAAQIKAILAAHTS